MHPWDGVCVALPRSCSIFLPSFLSIFLRLKMVLTLRTTTTRVASAAAPRQRHHTTAPRRATTRRQANTEPPSSSVDPATIDADAVYTGEPEVAANERPSEKFMVRDGKFQCKKCNYEYDSSRGDPEYPVSAGTNFANLPDDWTCPTCGSAKAQFSVSREVIAGFEQNQGYGFGTNSMTGGQKSSLIYGALGFFFVLFLLGYLLD